MTVSFKSACLAVTLLASTGAVACHPATAANSPERQTARGAILLLARGVSVADETCATVAEQQRSKALAKTCRQAYGVARDALLAAEAGIDAWDSGQQGNTICATANAATALSQVAAALTQAGASVPSIVVDALSLSQPIAEVCHGSK